MVVVVVGPSLTCAMMCTYGRSEVSMTCGYQFEPSRTFPEPKEEVEEELKNGRKLVEKSERAKGAEKASCGERLSNIDFWESPFLLCPLKVCS